MMVEVDYRSDETLLSVSSHGEGNMNEPLDRNSSLASYEHRVATRDSSQTPRDREGDGSRDRPSFQTSQSILNCTSEGETEDETEEECNVSFLFDDDDFHSALNQSLEQEEDRPVVTPVTAASSTASRDCCVNDKQWWLDTSLQNVTDSFVSLCSSRPDETCGNLMDATEKCGRQLRHQVQSDLLHLLGCDAPGDFWDGPVLISGNTKPVRRSPRQRAEHIRKIRHELLEGIHDIASSRSFQQLEWDIDPIEQGYDSDPGEVFPTLQGSLRQTSLLDEEENTQDYHFYDSHRERVAHEYQRKIHDEEPQDDYDRHIYEAVQEALNYTWTLTWHAEGKPMLIQFWIERGTMLNLGSVVVEPKFMWRQVYQPSLSTKKTLSKSSRKPMDVRVLNVCRIVEAPLDLDRTKYPMARTSGSFFVKTCRDQVFLFEASSAQERAQIIDQWKLVVARLASLAVTEDMEAMAKEFFTSAVTWQMLTSYDS